MDLGKEMMSRVAADFGDDSQMASEVISTLIFRRAGCSAAFPFPCATDR